MQGIHAVMPVFRGAPLWQKALDSLAACRHLFGEVVISFDGPARAVQAQSLRDFWGTALRPQVLVTPREMSSMEHVRWFMAQAPITTFKASELMCLWAEDDVASPVALESAFEVLLRMDSPVLFSSWARLGPEDALPEVKHETSASRYDIISQDQIVHSLTLWARKKRPSSITGLTGPIGAFRSHYTRRNVDCGGQTLLSGHRTEYFIATQPLIKNLLRWESRVVGIVQHAAQESLQTPQESARRDEGLYYLWFSITGQQMRVRDRVLALAQFSRKLLKTIPCTPKILCAGKAFWRTRNDAPD